MEDEFLIAMEIEMTIRSAGYQVMGPAANVENALQLLRAERPDAAVLDMNVAGEWITPVAELLRAMSVPFVLSSGHAAVDQNALPALRGVLNLGKPSTSERLLNAIDGLLRTAAPRGID